MDAAIENVVYPPGIRDLTEEVSTEELIRRLKDCCEIFQNMAQDEQSARLYEPLAHLLITERFIEHRSRDLRLLVACSIADIFRVSAPEAPYRDPAQIKLVMEFFIDQLKGLNEPQNPSFKRSFYLLENLSVVKTFNICFDTPGCHQIICRLFKVMFCVISDHQFAKIKRHIVNLLSPLISESDLVTQELLDVILVHLVEPFKSQRPKASILAREIFLKTATPLEPYIQAFFNNALMLGAPVQSSLSSHLYELIYEINLLNPGVLLTVIPQLEFKLKSTDEKERMEVTRTVGRMFSDQGSDMIETNKSLWESFISRFNDKSIRIRELCINFSKELLVHHPESRLNIIGMLKQRQRDPDEEIRFAVINTVIDAAKDDLFCIDKELLMNVRERSLDTKFRVRKAALLGLAKLYKQYIVTPDCPDPQAEDMLGFVRNKILNAYYQLQLEDRLLVERIFHTCLVPYQIPMKERMKILYNLFVSIDSHATKSLKEILRTQKSLRDHMKSILEGIQRHGRETNFLAIKEIRNKIAVIASGLLEPKKAVHHIVKFCYEMETNIRLLSMMVTVLDGTVTYTETENKVKEILQSLGNPVQSNQYYMTIKQLLERIVPVLLDREGLKYLVSFIKDSLFGDNEAQKSACKGLELILMLSYSFPHYFGDEELFDDIMHILKTNNERAVIMMLKALINVTFDLESNFPRIFRNLLPILERFVERGAVKEAKNAVFCIDNMVNDKQKVFGKIIQKLKRHFTLDSPHFRTSLVSIGYIAYLCHDMFAAEFKNVVAKVVVQDLLMLEKEETRGGDDLWVPRESLPIETKIKMAGMKVMVRWLIGMKDMISPAMSTLRLLNTVIVHDGDLMEKKFLSPAESSWMRLSAASCMLRLCRVPQYASSLSKEQFTVLAFEMSDMCAEVREKFLLKLSKGLYFLTLPIEFLAIYALAPIASNTTFIEKAKTKLIENIEKRRKLIKVPSFRNSQLPSYLPDYSIQYVVYLLAHAPFFPNYNDVPSLLKIRECLSFFLGTLIATDVDYSFAFYMRILENIKQTKDKSNPVSKSACLKLYAVCDVALHILMTKKNFVLKDFPGVPMLDSKFFSDPEPKYNNLKTYLPAELMKPDVLAKAGFDIDLYKDTEGEKDKAVVPSVFTAEQIQPSNKKPNHSRESRSRENSVPSSSNQSNITASIVKTKRISEDAVLAENSLNSSVSQPKTSGISRKALHKPSNSNGSPQSPEAMKTKIIQHKVKNNGSIDNMNVSSNNSSEINSNNLLKVKPNNPLKVISNDLPETSSTILPESNSSNFPKSISSDLSESISNNLSESISNNLSESISNNLSESISNNLSESISNNLSESISNNSPEIQSDISDTNLSNDVLSEKNHKLPRKSEKMCEISLNKLPQNLGNDLKSLSPGNSTVSEITPSLPFKSNEHNNTQSPSPSNTNSESPTPSNFQNLIKQCNVYLKRTEVLDYLNKRKSSDMDSEDFLNHGSTSNNHINGECSKKRGRPAKRIKRMSPLEKVKNTSLSQLSTVKSSIRNGKLSKEVKTHKKQKPYANHLSESTRRTNASIREIRREITAEINEINNVHEIVKTKGKKIGVKQTKKPEEQLAAKQR
ncbi:sister chromatid cohesion protein PDS5 homolog B-B [Nephila pilipes]|uniref:Sister chromatid cohesion protein PDS5 homolog B-B n=1 Tax=Nephila pilipes TaxID=299642 RepID=A0A8X6JSC7_NEPPI|nr:sister chromatid cohesion protein PDS5 homolog B-B [Nephila pilipes]